MIRIIRPRKILFSLLLICFGVVIVFIISCEDVDLVAANIVTTAEMSFISETEANGGGNIYNGGRTSVSSRGICWGTEPMPTIQINRTLNGSGDGSFTSTLTDLSPNTTYHVRAYASSIHGTSYGNNVTFSTNYSDIPILETSSISNISSTSSTSGGTIFFEGKGRITARGLCWSTNYPPGITDEKTIDGTGKGTFTSTISGLDPESSYYVRAYATNSEGTGYGNVLHIKPFKTRVTDIDGNIYNTVSIGTQVWTVENLTTTRYQNGDLIQNILDNSLWDNTETGAYCDYDNDSINTNTYGRLYNWFAASDTRNIAPKGWHVATYEDYQLLVNYLGDQFDTDEKTKNSNALNSFGFNALPGGKRNKDGIFYDKGIYPYFWTSTEYHGKSTWARYLSFEDGDLNLICLNKNCGFSVRCVRD